MYQGITDYHDAQHRIETDRTSFRGSSSSSISPSGAAGTSSKAVLSALRALQDKIRRLEAEKIEATEEAARLRIQIRNHEMESDRFKQRDALASQKNLHEVRTLYERILAEKCETEARLLKLEDRNRGEEKISADLRAKIRDVEDEKYSGLITIKDLESRRTQLQNQVLHVREKEKDLAETVAWETKCSNEDIDILGSKLLSLQEDLSDLSNQKKEAQINLTELDRYVSQILLVNESLVARLSGKPAGVERATAWTPGISHPESIVKHMQSSSTYGTPSQIYGTSLSKKYSHSDNSLYEGSHEGSYNRDVTTHRMHPKEQRTYASRGSNSAALGGERVRTLMSRRGAPQQQNALGRIDGVSDWMSDERERSTHSAYGEATPSPHITGFGTPLITSPYAYSTNSTVNHHQSAPSFLKEEEEFRDLNEQYQRILSNSKHALHGADASETELVRLMQKLHQKGEQMKGTKIQATY